MTVSEGALGRRLDRVLWIGVAAGLFADTYLPFAANGWCVRSPLGLLWPLATAAALVAITVLSFRGLRPWQAATIALAGAGALFCVALAILNLVPPVARDELTHHLAIPALYLRAGRVIELPFADQSYYPMLLALIYTPLLAQGWESAAKYLHMGFAVAASGIVCLYLRPRVPAALALFAALLLLTTPTVAVLAASAYVDLALLFYATIAVVGLLRWSETGQRASFIAAAFAAGLAMTVKYNGVLVIVLLAAGVILLARPRRAAAALGAAIAFGLLSSVPLLPWLAKNVIETGNPVFPLLNSVFGGRPLPSRPSIDLFTKRRLIYGESWLEIALTPVRVFLTGRDGDPARFDGAFNPLYLLGFAAACLPGAARRTRLVGGFAAALLLLTFLTVVFRSRYAIAVLPPLILLTAEAMARWPNRPPWRAFLVTVAVGALAFNAVHFALFWQRIDPLAYVTGRQSRAAFIARFVPEYPVAEWANTHLPADANLHLSFLGNRGYYWARPYSYDMQYSGTTLRDAVLQADSPTVVVRNLRQKGFTHIVAADALLGRFMRDNLEPVEHERWQAFVGQHLRPLRRAQGIGLYAID